jgi:hypothetical protein
VCPQAAPHSLGTAHVGERDLTVGNILAGRVLAFAIGRVTQARAYLESAELLIHLWSCNVCAVCFGGVHVAYSELKGLQPEEDPE